MPLPAPMPTSPPALGWEQKGSRASACSSELVNICTTFLVSNIKKPTMKYNHYSKVIFISNSLKEIKLYLKK